MLPLWPKGFRHFKNVRLFLTTLPLTLTLFIIAAAWLLYAQVDRLVLRQARKEAQAYAEIINYTMMWNAGFDGVYVDKKKAAANLYLLKLGIDPDIVTAEGRVFTLRNHAIMTKEISMLSQSNGGASFRIVNTDPLNPENSADPLEREAIRQFRSGRGELSRLVLTSARGPKFRFVVPFYADKSCLKCHAVTGGDILGALSITIPVAQLVRHAETYKRLILLATAAIVTLVAGITYFYIWWLVAGLDKAARRLGNMALTDELTGMNNRWHTMIRLDEEFKRSLRRGEPLCILLIDIDYFKKINDTWGHPVGDRYLKWSAKRMGELVRGYDITGRIGGEEYLIISPGTSLEEAVVLAERLRMTIGGETVSLGEIRISATLSIGVTTMRKDDSDAKVMIKRADEALYQAKKAGRNRVVSR